MLKYADRLRTQLEKVERLEAHALQLETETIHARTIADKARSTYTAAVDRLVPIDVPSRPADLWPIDKKKSNEKTGKITTISKKREKQIEAEAKAKIALALMRK